MNTGSIQRHAHSQAPEFSSRKLFRAGFLSISLTVFLGFSFHLPLRLDQSLVQEKTRSVVLDKALTVAAQLESELNADVYLASGLAALVVAAPDLSSSSIETALKVLHSASPQLRNIALAPGNRISYVYPLPGNEKALGLYYPDVPDQWVKVKEAIDRKATVLAGPLKLRQGGLGLVSRTPVFLPDGRYWGMLSLVVDADLLLERAKQTALHHGLSIALRGKDGMGAQGDVFFGAPEFFDAQQESALLSIRVPGGSWQLAARANERIEGIPTRNQQWQLAGWLGCGLIGTMFFLYLMGRYRVNSSEKQFRAILETTPDGIIVIDSRGTIEVFNPGAEAMFGYQASEVLGQPVKLLMNAVDARWHDDYIAHSSQAPARDMAKGREIHGRRKNGSMFPIEVKVGGVEVEGRLVHVGILRDITERHLAQQQLLELATRDSLTGVANRRALMGFLQEHWTLSLRFQHPLSVLMIDADNFKSINDRFGHHVGDHVLIRLAELAGGCLRATDKFGRIGGEEFLAVLPETGPEQAEFLADRLLKTIAAAEVDAGVEPLQFTVSIGIASLGHGAQTPEALMKQADVALYQAKEQGRNRYVTG